MPETSSSEFPPLQLYRCGSKHAFFRRYSECPLCGASTSGVREHPRATLISQTTVRMNPGGDPFRLGLAQTDYGARTLCIIETGVSHDENETVMLRRKGELYYAHRTGDGRPGG